MKSEFWIHASGLVINILTHHLGEQMLLLLLSSVQGYREQGYLTESVLHWAQL